MGFRMIGVDFTASVYEANKPLEGLSNCTLEGIVRSLHFAIFLANLGRAHTFLLSELEILNNLNSHKSYIGDFLQTLYFIFLIKIRGSIRFG